jgi:SAM-dependent methyltransferase
MAHLPQWMRSLLVPFYWKARLALLPTRRRPYKYGETSKARARRQREGFFANYCSGLGLDIGYGGDPVVDTCDVWDIEHGDAQFLRGLDAAHYDFVYSSHTLEDLPDPAAALKNWWRVLKPGGFLILYLPDRNLYEKTLALPSRWNSDHKRFFLLEKDEAPDTVGVLPLISSALPGSEIVHAVECREGHTLTDPLLHSDGEYSLEIVVRKPK